MLEMASFASLNSFVARKPIIAAPNEEVSLVWTLVTGRLNISAVIWQISSDLEPPPAILISLNPCLRFLANPSLANLSS